MDIVKCKICGREPDNDTVNLGRYSKGWLIECSYDMGYENEYPDISFIEHRISVYERSEEQAIQRWNDMWNNLK